MGRVSKTIELFGVYKSKKIEAMFDTGAKNNFLPSIFKDGETIEELGFKEFFGTHSFFMANESITKGDIVQFNEIRIVAIQNKILKLRNKTNKNIGQFQYINWLLKIRNRRARN